MQSVTRTSTSITQCVSAPVGSSKSTSVRPNAAVSLSARSVSGSVKCFESKRSMAMKIARSTFTVQAGPPTVTETKDKFIKAYSKPIPAIFNNILQEMLVLQHVNRYSTKYQYSPIAALGFVSVFDGIFEMFEYGKPADIFTAYIEALDEDPAKYRADAEALTEACKGKSGAELAELDAVKSLTAQDSVLHSRFLAIGVFRMLELAGLTEPTALAELIEAAGLKSDAVNRDLMTYKSLLSKLAAAKELQAEFVERERKKTAEREAEKAKAAAESEKADA